MQQTKRNINNKNTYIKHAHEYVNIIRIASNAIDSELLKFQVKSFNDPEYISPYSPIENI